MTAEQLAEARAASWVESWHDDLSLREAKEIILQDGVLVQLYQSQAELAKVKEEVANYRGHLFGCGKHGLWQGMSCIGCLEQQLALFLKVVLAAKKFQDEEYDHPHGGSLDVDRCDTCNLRNALTELNQQHPNWENE